MLSCFSYHRYEQTCSLLETRKAHIMKQQATLAHSSSMTKSKSVKKPKVCSVPCRAFRIVVVIIASDISVQCQ